MLYLRLIEIFFLCILFQGSFQENQQRDGKVFSLFSIVTFPNSGCSSQSTTGNKARNGTCFTSTECSDKGGTVSGNCAAGFGVCCLFITSTSGATVSQNCSYIQNPNFPSAYASETAISFTVTKCSSDVCALRLDFETFTTAGPTGGSDNTAAIDTFQVTATPSNIAIPAISGENTGQHVYVELGNEATASATLAFTFGTSTISRVWEVKVTQLECTSRSLPPTGCAQYFTSTTGRIETFNYANTGTDLKQHLHSQDYNICIRKAEGFSCVQYTLCGDTDAFSLNKPDAAAKGHLGTNCALDYITFSGAVACGTMTNVGKMCGLFFDPITDPSLAQSVVGVCDCTEPFGFSVFTNAVGAEAQDTDDRGVCLEYQQY